ncbi:hypothetical protein L873DRAFT_1016757 [Choiromyces venosus 120613-1]|uniref:Uncharacterized protein n=1 Tax=Choiromyces venosus 120613-1 TaxID=1336337 RepID=A0A3N4JK34_9PEZI|nr:hypothetical protein L873DRAFT_1016757 [Choiromyces venosus 120613-1]
MYFIWYYKYLATKLIIMVDYQEVTYYFHSSYIKKLSNFYVTTQPFPFLYYILILIFNPITITICI